MFPLQNKLHPQETSTPLEEINMQKIPDTYKPTSAQQNDTEIISEKFAKTGSAAKLAQHKLSTHHRK